MVEGIRDMEPIYIQCSSTNEKRKLQELLIRLREGEVIIVRAFSSYDYTVKVELRKK